MYSFAIETNILVYLLERAQRCSSRGGELRHQMLVYSLYYFHFEMNVNLFLFDIHVENLSHILKRL